MAKILSCAEVAPSANCNFEARGETEEEVFRKATEHAKEHGISDVDPELAVRLKSFIHDERDPFRPY